MFGTPTAVREMRDMRDMLANAGEVNAARGRFTSMIALSLGALSLLVFLTTPELCVPNPVDVAVDVQRHLLFVALLVAGGLSLANLVLGRRRNLNAVAFTLVAAAALCAGASLPFGDVPHNMPYFGMDWIILDVRVSGLIFAGIAKKFPLQEL